MARTVKQPYRKARVFDPSCRCHGGCTWCLWNRMKQARMEEQRADYSVTEWHEQHEAD